MSSISLSELNFKLLKDRQWLECPPREWEVVGSTPSHNRPKSLKLVGVAFSLGAQDYGNSTTTGRQCQDNGLVKYLLYAQGSYYVIPPVICPTLAISYVRNSSYSFHWNFLKLAIMNLHDV